MSPQKNGSKTETLDDKVIEAVDSLDAPDDGLIHLSSGVTLRAKQAPPLTLIKIMARFESSKPKPPIYHNELMGRDMENPDDPDYLDRMRGYQAESSNAIITAMILLGTELVDVPKKFPRPEDDSWLEDYNELGLNDSKPENDNWRYLNWVNLKAVLSADDLKLIQDAVGRLSGVPEGAVKSAETFPGGDKKIR